MDKKPLIVVSLCAVALLVLDSLSNVVGYQSVKSTTLSDSPLFMMRTKKAINQEINPICQSNYLGKERETYLRFPIKDTKTELTQYIFNILNKMTDNQLDQLLKKIISYRFENKIDKITLSNYEYIINKFKTNNLVINNEMKTDSMFYTTDNYCFTYGGFRCLLKIIIYIIILIPFEILYFIQNLLTIKVCI